MKKNLLLLALLGIMLTGCGSEPVEDVSGENGVESLAVENSTVVEMTKEPLSKATINGREFNLDVPIEKAMFECIEGGALFNNNYRIISSSEDERLSFYFPNTCLLVTENKQIAHMFYEDGTDIEFRVSETLLTLSEEEIFDALAKEIQEIYCSKLTETLDIEEDCVLESIYKLMLENNFLEVEIIEYPDGIVSAQESARDVVWRGGTPCYYYFVLFDGTTIYKITQENGGTSKYKKTLEEFEEYKETLQK